MISYTEMILWKSLFLSSKNLIHLQIKGALRFVIPEDHNCKDDNTMCMHQKQSLPTGGWFCYCLFWRKLSSWYLSMICRRTYRVFHLCWRKTVPQDECRSTVVSIRNTSILECNCSTGDIYFQMHCCIGGERLTAYLLNSTESLKNHM